MAQHIVRMSDTDDDERTSWECSCGRSGSAATWRVDAASDQHIPEGETRVDRHPGNSPTYSRHDPS